MLVRTLSRLRSWHQFSTITSSDITNHVRIATSSAVNSKENEQRSQTKPLLQVCVVGRPNTGKSTLYNRITHSQDAIVSDVPGTTRDRRDGVGRIAGLPVRITDTGGLDDRGSVCTDIQIQIEYAIKTADVILFMLDARSGVNMIDEHFAKWLRVKLGKMNVKGSMKNKIIVLANKTEGAHLSNKVLDTLAEAYRLGLGDPLPISASHGDGLSELAEILLEEATKLDKLIDYEEMRRYSKSLISTEDKVIQVAIMGKPNTGKSSLLNAILNEERVIAGPVAGLTRDSIHVSWEYADRRFNLVDTAGLTRITPNSLILHKDSKEKKMHRERNRFGMTTRIQFPGIESMDPDEDPSQFSDQVSELALMSALKALKYAQVVLLVIEGDQGKFAKIDLQLAWKCLKEGRALIIVANKRDLVAINGVSGKQYEEGVKKHCDKYLREFGDVCVVSTSATQNEGIHKILRTAITIHDAWSKRISTWVLNKWIKDTLVTAPTTKVGNKVLNIKYMTQVKARPPTFALFCNVKLLPQSFERFLRARIQHDFKLQGIPLRFVVRQTKVESRVKPSLLKHGKQSRHGAGNRIVSSSRGVGKRNRENPSKMYTLRKQRLEGRKLQKRIVAKRKSRIRR